MRATILVLLGIASALALLSCHMAAPSTPESAIPAETSSPVTFEPDEDLFAWVFMEQFEGEQPDDGAEPDELAEEEERKVGPRSPVVVRELYMARAIEKRTPQGIDAQFTMEDEKLWAYVKLQNRDQARQVSMEWLHQDARIKKIVLDVGLSDTWRTWSSHRIRPGDDGQWELVVRDDKGRLLETTTFQIETDDSSEPTSPSKNGPSEHKLAVAQAD